MIKFLLASHGKYASGMKTSLEILLGNAHNLTTIDAYVGDENPEDLINEFFEKVESDDQVVMLSDLLGGSVNTLMYKHLTRSNTYLIAGVNLALVLELVAMAAVNENGFEKEYLMQTVENSRNALQLLELEESEEATEEDFF